jgi:hypothetical protein
MNWKTIVIIILAIFIIIQFFHPEKNVSATPSGKNISTLYPVPQDVDTTLRKACYDCHSNNTRYPWYNNIEPVAWWLKSHIDDGKRSLNFDAFASYKISRQYKKLKDIIDEIKQGDMPLSSYTFEHKDARLTDAEKETIYDWCNALRDSIQAKYPADSLVMKK